SNAELARSNPKSNAELARPNPKSEIRNPKSKGRAAAVPDEENNGWRVSPFRLLLYAAFCYLSLQATRNSHQFAAVVGSITAWNFGEWAAAVRRRRAAFPGAGSGSRPASISLTPRLVAGAAIVAVLVWVGSGW